MYYAVALTGFLQTEQDDPDAMLEYRIGGIYLHGKGNAEDPTEALKWFERSADNGNVYAAYQAAELLADGKAVPKDEAHAQKYFAAALAGFLQTEQSDPDAMLEYRIGGMFLHGKGIAKDSSEALKWFEQSANKSNVYATYQAAELLTNGNAVSKDEARAGQYYDAALKGFLQTEENEQNDQIEYRIANMYLDGKGTVKDVSTAMSWFQKSADNGNHNAVYQMAELFHDGTRVQKDEERAQLLYAAALEGFLHAEEDEPSAQTEYRIASMYLEGKGTVKDVSAAMCWFQKSVDNGNHYAEYQMAELLHDGTQVEKDEERAQFLYAAALEGFQQAEEDEPSAQTENRIANMYLEGKGTAKDVSTAMQWFQKSADNGNHYAEYQMAELLHDGTQVEKDEERAQFLYAAALEGFQQDEEDEPNAQTEYRIASMYLDGKGVERNVSEAMRWFQKSADNGNHYAEYQMAELLHDGTRIQKDEDRAQRLYSAALAGFLKSERDDPEARTEYRTANMSLNGKGTTKNITEALRWLQESANRKNYYAEYQIGQIFEEGTEVSKNDPLAQIHFHRALTGFLENERDNPDTSTEFRIGQMFYRGKGTVQDYSAAWHWFSLSASKDNIYALFQQARMIQNGEGVMKNEQQAQVLYAESFRKFLQAFREDPSPELQYKIGTMYEFGLGVKKDAAETKRWYNAAAEAGNEAAEERLRQIQAFESQTAIHSVLSLFRVFARAIGNNIDDSTTHRYQQDRKLLQKERMLKIAHGEDREQEQTM